ncbi:unnamed protein product [Cuscuta epithymum]|uniref:PGG domain-containing protein n=1 Tax=Cuscuta epithymum TaxID=186058 RepID=A0AAV0CFK5_9ASTE|nr:unnamed protein product [Cuscuta epithymum]
MGSEPEYTCMDVNFYSLLCRHARVSSLPTCQLADEELSFYKNDRTAPPHTTVGKGLKSSLERHRVLQRVMLVLALLGACMVISDGILSPAISGVGYKSRVVVLC